MTEGEFRDSLARAIARDAADSVDLGVWAKSEAEKASLANYARELPEGMNTPGFCFRNIVDAASGERLGETWFSTHSKGGKAQFWLNWIWTEPAHRRRGIATQALRLLSEAALKAGADQIGLYVLAKNQAALAL